MFGRRNVTKKYHFIVLHALRATYLTDELGQGQIHIAFSEFAAAMPGVGPELKLDVRQPGRVVIVGESQQRLVSLRP